MEDCSQKKERNVIGRTFCLQSRTFSSPAAVAYVFCKPTEWLFRWELGKVDARDPSALPVASRRRRGSCSRQFCLGPFQSNGAEAERESRRAGTNSEMRKVFCECLFLRLWSPSFKSRSACRPDLLPSQQPCPVPREAGPSHRRFHTAICMRHCPSDVWWRLAKRLACCLLPASPDVQLILQQYG